MLGPFWHHQGAFDELHDAQHSALHGAILRTPGQLQGFVRQLQGLPFVASVAPPLNRRGSRVVL